MQDLYNNTMLTKPNTQTAETLNRAIEFDCPFEVHDDGTVTSAHGLYAPADVYWIEDTNGIGDIEMDNSSWYPLYGFSSQYNYPGPVMHPSEYVGGRMAQEMLDNPGVYVVTAVTCLTDDDDIAGWIALEYVG